jgi:hypothetical protein
MAVPSTPGPNPIRTTNRNTRTLAHRHLHAIRDDPVARCFVPFHSLLRHILNADYHNVDTLARHLLFIDLRVQLKHRKRGPYHDNHD